MRMHTYGSSTRDNPHNAPALSTICYDKHKMKADYESDSFLHATEPLFKQRRLWDWLFVVGVILIVVTAQTPLIFVTPLLFIVALIKGVRIHTTLEEKVWQQFAARLDSSQVDPEALRYTLPLSGAIGSIGERRMLRVLAQGVYQGYPIRVLQQGVLYKPQSMNGSYSRGYRILEIVTNQTFYHVFIDAKGNHARIWPNAMHVLSRSVRHNKTLSVEGDVNKFFDIYVPNNDQYKSLITLSPEKLLALRDFGVPFDVEFVDNKIYVICDSKIKSAKDIMVYQQRVLELVAHIGVDVIRRRTDIDGSLTTRTPVVLTF